MKTDKNIYEGLLIAAVISVWCAGPAFAQDADGTQTAVSQNMVTPAEDEAGDVIVTDVGFDQMKFDGEEQFDIQPDVLFERFDKSFPASDLKIKEDQIITTSRSLRKMIEENAKLNRQNQNMDEEIRQLRGQRNIDTNRLNTITVERDAYKNQNEILSGLTQRQVEDIEKLQSDLQAKEKELMEQAAMTPSEAAATAAAMAAPEIGLGTIQVTKEDREKGHDILLMLDQVKRQGEKLKVDEAKVHYNMGNMFFKRKEYQRAKSEYESAVRLVPEDASAHFNLAFVSSEYLYDYKSAMTHYKEYLELNPAAEDGPVVREKIIEAELFLRAKIPSDLENDIVNEEKRHFR